MKRFGNLWQRIIAYDNLLLAYKKARMGKRRREEVALFGLELEKELIMIQARLHHKTWKPGAYRIIRASPPRAILALIAGVCLPTVSQSERWGVHDLFSGPGREAKAE